MEEPQRPILKGDLGMVLKSKAKHAAVSKSFSMIHFNRLRAAHYF